VEHDEAPENAVVREVEEETGLITKVSRLLEVFPKKDDGLADIVIVYTMKIISGALQAADDAEDVGWFGRDELPELVFYPSIHLVGEKWRNERL
jgi:8-oxo-dGTP diphosphatase